MNHLRIFSALFLSALFLLASGFRVNNNPARVKWSAIVIHTGSGEADIHFTADIPDGWRMYGQSMAGKTGALPITIHFDPSPKFELVGQPVETGKVVNYYQADLGLDVETLEGQAKYVQHIRFREGDAFAVKCMIDYMLTRTGEILPPDDEDFTITISGN